MAIAIADGPGPCSPTPSLALSPGSDSEKTCSPPKQSMWHRLGFRRWLGRDDRGSQSPPGDRDPNHLSNNNNNNTAKPHDNLTRRLSRRVGVGLPRATTFKRQNSERRDRLAPFQPEPRAVSADRRRPLSAQRRTSPPPDVGHRLSAPEVQWRDNSVDTMVEEPAEANHEAEVPSEWDGYPETTDAPESAPEDVIEMEMETRWILNLSMHFRDRSQREKFFVTYAESSNRWRRATISCDYRDAEADSLEQDLKELRYQRDKCARIYESLRESLPEIQFYDTVTNLKLETRDGRLHVHVTEDVNEIIPYPPISCVGHLYNARFVPESTLHFGGHLSGFVYNVQLDGKVFIKKEIPGPETVDEFLYEINALHALKGSHYVIQVEGVVVDDRRDVVKGLLISHAEQGALVDILYEERDEIPWTRRERWARQIVNGLCEIHESGYVQGDFTLSNIVVDANGNAKIIDINRRGCPVGWEPPEIAAKIESNQRISMYIGVKTDLFQLGMTLWALAMQDDEPERQDRPLILGEDVDVPDYYRKLVAICLSSVPRHRLSAKELVGFFPRDIPASDYLPPVHPQGDGSLKLGRDELPPYYGPSASASLLHSTASENFSDNLDRGCLGRSSLDDEYSLSQCDSNFVPVPRAESECRTTFVDGELNARRDFEDSEVLGFPPVQNQHGQLHAHDSDERDFRDNSRPSVHTDGELYSTNVEGTEYIASVTLNEEGMGSRNDSDSLNEGRLLEQKDPLPPLRSHNSPKDVGIRTHTVCPLRGERTRQQFSDSTQYHESSLTSLTSQSTHFHQSSTPEPNHIHTSEGEAGHANPKRETPHSVESLLDSTLPINPAQVPKQESVPTSADYEQTTQQTISPRVDHPLRFQGCPARLSDSKLPINPAFTEPLQSP